VVQIRNEWVEPLDPQRVSLAQVLDELAGVLRAAGQRRWARYISDCRSRLRGSGTEKLMRAYGGMGSLNDLWIGEPRQDRFEELKQQAYAIARQLMSSPVRP
jgi:hypothetical protein